MTNQDLAALFEALAPSSGSASSALCWTSRFLRLVLFLVFLISFLGKVQEPEMASKSLANLLALPEGRADPVLAVVMAIELAIAVLLASGRGAFWGAGLAVAVLGTGSYFGVQNLQDPIECGCFGLLVESRTDVLFLLRNLSLTWVGLIVMSLDLLVSPRRLPIFHASEHDTHY
jgi:hypothetical protein